MDPLIAAMKHMLMSSLISVYATFIFPFTISLIIALKVSYDTTVNDFNLQVVIKHSPTSEIWTYIFNDWLSGDDSRYRRSKKVETRNLI